MEIHTKEDYRCPETCADAYIPVLLCDSLIDSEGFEDIVDEEWQF